MALDVTVGGANSDSYGTIAEADAYHAAFGNAEWADYDEPTKESSMRFGAVYVDSFDHGGQKATQTQARQYPRVGQRVDGFLIDSTIIPRDIKHAQFEASLRRAAGEIGGDIESGSITEETVDVITVKYSEYSNNGRKTFPAIDSLLRKYILSSSGYHRVVK